MPSSQRLPSDPDEVTAAWCLEAEEPERTRRIAVLHESRRAQVPSVSEPAQPTTKKKRTSARKKAAPKPALDVRVELGIEATEERQKLEAEAARKKRVARHKALETGKEPAMLECWPEPVRKVPAALMRSAVFSVVNAVSRKSYDRFTPILSTRDCQISYKGVQLTQADLTVWMHDLHLARGQLLHGCRVVYHPYAFLRAIGHTDAKSNYDRLWQNQRNLRDAAIHVITDRYEYEGSLVLEVLRDTEDDRRSPTALRLSPTIVEMFDARDGWHHWQQRIALRRDALAQRLMALWATFVEPVPYPTTTLFELAGLQNKVATSRRQKLRRACESLKAIGFLTAYHFDIQADTLHVTRAPTPLSVP